MKNLKKKFTVKRWVRTPINQISKTIVSKKNRAKEKHKKKVELIYGEEEI